MMGWEHYDKDLLIFFLLEKIWWIFNSFLFHYILNAYHLSPHWVEGGTQDIAVSFDLFHKYFKLLIKKKKHLN